MKALVLEKQNELAIRDITINESLGAHDLKIQILACGICGSDVHYFKEGRIGSFVVKEPMVLGHEAAGIVVAKGSEVRSFDIGDRVCMEPGVPNFMSKESLGGNYNLDKDVVFWATPPVHGVMRETVIHPAAFVFKLPSNVSFYEGAMVEPLAIGIESAKQAAIEPGDVAVVIGAGPIGIMIAISALAGGCSKVIISDVVDDKLSIAASYEGIIGVNSAKQSLEEVVFSKTNNRGADVLFEASGSTGVYKTMFDLCRRGGKAVLVGMMNDLPSLDVTQLQILGISISTVFRYRNCFERALTLISSGKIDLKKLITKVFSFDESIEAYNFAAEGRVDTVKVMVDFQ